jgi:hypothetical protein
MFESLKEAVDEQLANCGNGDAGDKRQPQGNGRSNGNGNGKRRATKAQCRAIHAIAKRIGEQVADIVHDRFSVAEPEELSVREASSLIEDLKERADQ